MANNKSLLCDTNVLVYFIDGNINAGQFFNSYNIIFSSITYIEVLSNSKLSSERRELLRDFLTTFTLIETSPLINNLAVGMRLNYKLDTPDGLIAATAKYLDIPLLTFDSAFLKIKEIQVIPFSK